MRIISRTKLIEFWEQHADAESALNSWFKATQRFDWASPVDVRNSNRHADTIGDFIVFNICQNDYRLVVRADYVRRILYVWGVYTHREYDRLDLRSL